MTPRPDRQRDRGRLSVGIGGLEATGSHGGHPPQGNQAQGNQAQGNQPGRHLAPSKRSIQVQLIRRLSCADGDPLRGVEDIACNCRCAFG